MAAGMEKNSTKKESNMPNFAVIDKNNKVLNTILASSKEDAELVTGETCIEYTDANPAIIGLGYADGIFEQPPVIESIDPVDTGITL